jgi:hypothetical protein
MSNDKQFDSILTVIVSQLTEKITEELKVPEKDAINALYRSKLYSFLEDEDTKIWQFSVPLLFDLFIEERTTGAFTFPER